MGQRSWSFMTSKRSSQNSRSSARIPAMQVHDTSVQQQCVMSCSMSIVLPNALIACPLQRLTVHGRQRCQWSLAISRVKLCLVQTCKHCIVRQRIGDDAKVELSMKCAMVLNAFLLCRWCVMHAVLLKPKEKCTSSVGAWQSPWLPYAPLNFPVHRNASPVEHVCRNRVKFPAADFINPPDPALFTDRDPRRGST